MSTIISAVNAFIVDEDGVTAIEYGMIAALVAAGCVAVVTTLGDRVEAAFTFISSKLPATFT